jgi:hypothetical protein
MWFIDIPLKVFKGGFYKDNKTSYCQDCHYKRKDGGTGYDVFGGKEYQDVYFPDYQKSNNGMEKTPIYRKKTYELDNLRRPIVE